MELIPSYVVYTLKLDSDESQVFFRKLTSSKDMEIFAHVISDRNTSIKIHNVEELAVIDIEVMFDIGTTFADIKDSAKRIKKDIEYFIDESPLSD